MKFKKGDRVKVISNLKVDKTYGGLSFTEKMKELTGKVVTIKNVYGDSYSLEEDRFSYSWNDEMLEEIARPTKAELLKVPVGTIITTDAKMEYYQKWIKIDNDCFINIDDSDYYLRGYDINEDLTLDTDLDYGTRIIEIEEPEFRKTYDYSQEVKEMTVAEIEKALGHAVKIVKEEK